MRLIHPSRHTSERGDTIVEVLICILILSMVLAGAFTMTNKNLQAVRDSQERSQAVKVVETQIERLRGTQHEEPYCIDSTAGMDADAESGAVDVGSSDKQCYFNDSGQLLSEAMVTGSFIYFMKDSGQQIDPAAAAELSSDEFTTLYSSGNGVIYRVIISQQDGNYVVTANWVTIRGALGKMVMYYAVN